MCDQTTPWVQDDDDEVKADDDINSILPDEILEEVIAKLHIASIGRVGAISYKWKYITMSKAFISRLQDPESERHAYLMFSARRHRREYNARVYDPALGKWRVIKIPFQIKRDWTVSASSGLVCFLPWLIKSQFVYVYNPITNLFKKIYNPRKGDQRNPIGVSISVSKTGGSYIMAVINLKYHQKHALSTLAIDVYSSEKKSWETRNGFRIPSIEFEIGSSAICDEVLYLLCRRRFDYYGFSVVLAYDLACRNSEYKPIRLPNRLRVAQLLNMREELVMVASPAGYGEIRIFVLKDKEWLQVATRAFGSVHGTGSKVGSQFFCSGYGKTIRIWTGWKRDNLMFDMESGEWSSERNVFRVEKQFNAIFFKPRFDIAP